ncbi:MAG TPA: hypothetical protein VFC61_02300 [Blastocatellia bacterium]|nr:hypothetical protein [Blastocatellia bacterium]
MRLVESPLDHPPRACAVTNREDGELIDFQVVIDRPLPSWLYLNRLVVEEAGELIGMVPAKKVKKLEERMEALSRELDDLQETMKIYADFEEKLAEKEPAPCP